MGSYLQKFSQPFKVDGDLDDAAKPKQAPFQEEKANFDAKKPVPPVATGATTAYGWSDGTVRAMPEQPDDDGDVPVGAMTLAQPKYGPRPDSSLKGRGFFGELNRPDGSISTELSVGMNIDGKETLLPALVPTLSKGEISYLLESDPADQKTWETITGQRIIKKAARHAADRIGQGKSPFANIDGTEEAAPPEGLSPATGKKASALDRFSQPFNPDLSGSATKKPREDDQGVVAGAAKWLGGKTLDSIIDGSKLPFGMGVLADIAGKEIDYLKQAVQADWSQWAPADAAKVVWMGAKALPEIIKGTYGRLERGGENTPAPGEVSGDAIEQSIFEAKKLSAELIAKAKELGEDQFLVPGITLKELAMAPENVCFSALSGASGLLVGAPIAMIPAPGARPAAWAAGTYAAGNAAFKMDKDMFITEQVRDPLNAYVQKTLGRDITPEEWQVVAAKFEGAANMHALWEAIPEAIGQAATLGLWKLPVGAFFKAPGVKNKMIKTLSKAGLAHIMKEVLPWAATSYVIDMGQELAMETLTQKGQAHVERKAGLRDDEPTWHQAFKEVAPSVIILQSIMGPLAGGVNLAAGGVKTVYGEVAKQTDSLVADQPLTVHRNMDDVRQSAKEESGDGGDGFKSFSQGQASDQPVGGVGSDTTRQASEAAAATMADKADSETEKAMWETAISVLESQIDAAFPDDGMSGAAMQTIAAARQAAQQQFFQQMQSAGGAMVAGRKINLLPAGDGSDAMQVVVTEPDGQAQPVTGLLPPAQAAGQAMAIYQQLRQLRERMPALDQAQVPQAPMAQQPAPVPATPTADQPIPVQAQAPVPSRMNPDDLWKQTPDGLAEMWGQAVGQIDAVEAENQSLIAKLDQQLDDLRGKKGKGFNEARKRIKAARDKLTEETGNLTETAGRQFSQAIVGAAVERAMADGLADDQVGFFIRQFSEGVQPGQAEGSHTIEDVYQSVVKGLKASAGETSPGAGNTKETEIFDDNVVTDDDAGAPPAPPGKPPVVEAAATPEEPRDSGSNNDGESNEKGGSSNENSGLDNTSTLEEKRASGRNESDVWSDELRQVHRDAMEKSRDDFEGVFSGLEYEQQAELLWRYGIAQDDLDVALDENDNEISVGGLAEVVRRRIKRGMDPRKRVDEMAAEEKDHAMSHSFLTGLKNKLAWSQRKPVMGESKASIDVNNLKAVNDVAGHAFGDALLILVGDAIKNTVVEENGKKITADNFYHVSGDEFLAHGDENLLDKFVQKVQNYLQDNVLEFTFPGEKTQYLVPGVSYGIDSALKSAETQLRKNKQALEATGERSGRGETPGLLFEERPTRLDIENRKRGLRAQRGVQNRLTPEALSSAGRLGLVDLAQKVGVDNDIINFASHGDLVAEISGKAPAYLESLGLTSQPDTSMSANTAAEPTVDAGLQPDEASASTNDDLDPGKGVVPGNESGPADSSGRFFFSNPDEDITPQKGGAVYNTVRVSRPGQPHEIKRVAGKAIDLKADPDHSFFVYQDEDGWYVVEACTGLSVSTGVPTKKKAIASAEKQLQDKKAFIDDIMDSSRETLGLGDDESVQGVQPENRGRQYATSSGSTESVTIDQAMDAFSRFNPDEIYEEDGKIVMRKNGRELVIEMPDDISLDEAAFMSGYRRAPKPGETPVGEFTPGRIRLKKGKAGRWVLDHETFHWLRKAGFISNPDYLLLKKAAKSAYGIDKLADVTEEDVANYVADELEARDLERHSKPLALALQKIFDLVDGFVNLIGHRTAAGVVRDIESGAISDRGAAAEPRSSNKRFSTEDLEKSPLDEAEKYEAVTKMAPVEVAPGPADKKSAEQAYAGHGHLVNNDGRSVALVKNAFKKIAGHRERDLFFRILPGIKDVFSTAQLIYSEGERKPGVHNNIRGYHNYLSKVRLGGNDYWVRFTVQEVNKPNGNELHNIFISAVEKTKAEFSDHLPGLRSPMINQKSSLLDHKLTQWLEDVKKKTDTQYSTGRPVDDQKSGKSAVRDLVMTARDAARRLDDIVSGFSKGNQKRIRQIMAGSLNLLHGPYKEVLSAAKAFDEAETNLRKLGLLNDEAGDPGRYTKWLDRDHVKARLAEAERSRRDMARAGRDPFGGSSSIDGMDRARSVLHRKYIDVMTWLVDKNLPIDAMQKRLKNVSEDVDLFLRETQRPKVAAYRIKKAWGDDIRPLISKMAEYGVGLADLELYAHARHAVEANASLRGANAKRYLDTIIGVLPKSDRVKVQEMVTEKEDAQEGRALSPEQSHDILLRVFDDFEENAKIKDIKKSWDEFSEKPSGMSDTEAAAILADNADNKNIEHLRLMLAEINDKKLDVLLESGVLPKEEYDAIKNKYEYYVPLYREGFEEVVSGTGRGLQRPGRAIKVRGGSTRQVVNIVANSVANYENALNRAAKADSARVFYSLVSENPNPDFWTIKKEKKTARYDNNGNIRMYPDGFSVAPNEIRIMVDGEQYLIAVNQGNKDAMLMLRTLKNEGVSSGWMSDALSKVNRFLARVNTTYAPEFILSNFIRDLQTAGINVHDTGVQSKQMLRGAMQSARAIYHVERDRRTGGDLEAMYDRFREAGGKIGWADVHGGIEKLANKINAEFETQAGKRPVRKTVSDWLQWVEDANTAVENGVRLHVFRLAVEQGMTDRKAAQIASDITVDFTRKGTAGPAINSLYLFANAGLQGSYRLIRAGAKSGKVRKIMAGVVAAGFLSGLLNSMVGGEDDDGEDYYNKIDDYIRERNMILMLPGTEGKYAKVPLPWGYNVFWNAGTELSRVFTQVDYDPLAGAGRMVSAIAGAFNPVQAGTVLQTLAPTIADPIVMVQENKNWFGGDLMPRENSFAKIPEPDSERYWRSVRTPSRWAAERINALTGGNKVRKGLIDVSPETIDLMIDTVGGSALRFFADSFQVPVRFMEKEIPQIHEVPFLRRVAGEQPEWANSQIYYRNLTKVLTAEAELKEYADTDYYDALKEKLHVFVDSGSGRSSLIGLAKGTESRLRRLRKARWVYTATGDTKMVGKVDAAIGDLYVQFNKAYNNAMK